MRLDLLCKQISLNLFSFNRNGSDCREKNYVLMEKYSTRLWVLILVLLIVFKVLLPTYKLDWILNFSSFLQYLAIGLQFFSYPSDLDH